MRTRTTRHPRCQRTPAPPTQDNGAAAIACMLCAISGGLVGALIVALAWWLT